MKLLHAVKITTLASILAYSAYGFAATSDMQNGNSQQNMNSNMQQQNMNSGMSTNGSMQMSDADITAAINGKLSADPLTTGSTVNVTTQNGTVTLNGTVNTDADVSKVVELAESTAGVKDVNTTNLNVKESKQPLADTIITAKVRGIFIREKLFGDKDISVMGIGVETNNGTVYLTGTVDTQEQANNAVKLAQSISGVQKVESKLEVKAASSS
ncbi:BON domain-containing protein [Aquicella lusitana]|uniref:Hyperosmotically inducible protein n=1 Tax=Aquicella lusitana TaxID=254246 RepID=A0A370GBA6_9COXI|nr:BON domain-containing protein [Aquicella lusitana]RDI40987.1 hyperosmotically inducible protein [Aquicella lusitana]VVC73608.1 Osmotically-inducible protein Y [Aquicella lusitana]